MMMMMIITILLSLSFASMERMIIKRTVVWTLHAVYVCFYYFVFGVIGN